MGKLANGEYYDSIRPFRGGALYPMGIIFTRALCRKLDRDMISLPLSGEEKLGKMQQPASKLSHLARSRYQNYCRFFLKSNRYRGIVKFSLFSNYEYFR